MHEVEMTEPERGFVDCWKAAGKHLQRCAQGRQLVWLKASLAPPFLEHLSFRLGNQLFFVRVEDVAQHVDTPGSRAGLRSISEGCRGHACLMPMMSTDGGWKPVHPGWGLVEVSNGKAISPPVLVTDDLIEMTDWELHDFAVQTVREALRKEGRQIMSSQGNPSVDPSVWFVGNDGPEWVVVRAVRYPSSNAKIPDNLADVERSCSQVSSRGNFASVAVASAQDAFEEGAAPTPLWRGHGMYVSYQGLTPLPHNPR